MKNFTPTLLVIPLIPIDLPFVIKCFNLQCNLHLRSLLTNLKDSYLNLPESTYKILAFHFDKFMWLAHMLEVQKNLFVFAPEGKKKNIV